MNFTLTRSVLIVATCLLAACGIAIPPDKAEYVGDWKGPRMSLSITQDGQLDYKRVQGNSTTSLNVPIKQFEGDNIVAGLGPMTSSFVVSQIPHEESGEWVMVVDGVRLVRQ